jgi:hypothetical protein
MQTPNGDSRTQNAAMRCVDECGGHERNGECQDGGPGSSAGICQSGFDCTDCE